RLYEDFDARECAAIAVLFADAVSRVEEHRRQPFVVWNDRVHLRPTAPRRHDERSPLRRRLLRFRGRHGNVAWQQACPSPIGAFLRTERLCRHWASDPPALFWPAV